MMRLTNAENVLSTLHPKEREFIKALASSRGAFTISDYANYHELTRQGSLLRLNKAEMRGMFKRVSQLKGSPLPYIFFVRKTFACVFNSDYKEPQTYHTLLDSLLRTKISPIAEGAWSHHVKQAAVLLNTDNIHVVDLDRNESAIITFVNSLKSDKPLILHTACTKRLAAFGLMKMRLNAKKEPVFEIKSPDLTWDHLFEERPRTPEKVKMACSNPAQFEIKYHYLSAFRNERVQIC